MIFSMPSSAPPVPALQNGDRLSRREFERRYKAMPHVKKAELIEGTVYMPSPVHFGSHSEPHSAIIGWLVAYAAATPHVSVGDNATVRLDLDNEPQPDALLRIDEDSGGQSHISEDDYVEGPPELIVEVAHSSVAYDLHDKKRAYRRNGVREYLVWQIEENRVDWFVLEGGEYCRLPRTRRDSYRAKPFQASSWTPMRSSGRTCRRCWTPCRRPPGRSPTGHSWSDVRTDDSPLRSPTLVAFASAGDRSSASRLLPSRSLVGVTITVAPSVAQVLLQLLRPVVTLDGPLS